MKYKAPGASIAFEEIVIVMINLVNVSHNTQFIESFNVNYVVRINSFILLDCTEEEYQFKCISVSFTFLFSC